MTCPWCGSNNIKHDVKQVTSAPVLAVELGNTSIPMVAVVNYSECECGLVFQEHRQSDEWYNWYYSSGTYRKTLGISQEDMDEDEKLRANVLIRWLDLLTIPFFPKKHIDIGSSRGYFGTSIENAYKCQSYGLELNVDYYSLIQTERHKGPTDFISAINVLEHTTDPLKELTKWSEMTNKYLLIEVPGLNTKGGPLRFAHLYYFPPELLKAKIIELGFDIVAMGTDPNTRIFAIKKSVL